MRKLLLIIFSLVFFVNSSPAFAASPTPSATPAPSCYISSINAEPSNNSTVNKSTTLVTLTIHSDSILAAGKYYIKLNGKVIDGVDSTGNPGKRQFSFNTTTRNLETFSTDPNGVILIAGHDNRPNKPTFSGGPYNLVIQNTSDSSDRGLCAVQIPVDKSTNIGSCNIGVTNSSFSPTDDISFIVSNLSDPNNTNKYHVSLHQDSDSGKVIQPNPKGIDDRSALSSSDLQRPTGYMFAPVSANQSGLQNYIIVVTNKCGDNIIGGTANCTETPVCSQKFCVSPDGNCGVIFTPTNVIFEGQGVNSPPAPQIPCASGGYNSTTENCDSVPTGLDIKIGTNATDFAASLMGIILSLAGAIMLFIIVITGYRLMFSQGDPEKLKAAREQLTGAVAGLLFIIFSVAILAFLGASIVHIPGFN